MLATLALLLGLAGTVVAVHDGDTVTVLDASRQQTRVRVEGIDCPELHQAFGRKAKQFTSELVYGKLVEVEGSKRDQFGRLLGRVLVDGRDLSLELARAGLAWHFVRYSSDKALAGAEAHARAAQRGLWVDPSPTPPWEYRKGHPRP
jgi:endonuclease YncB( thermonuclease family)